MCARAFKKECDTHSIRVRPFEKERDIHPIKKECPTLALVALLGFAPTVT